MTQSSPPERPARYQRSFSGLLAAMAVLVVVVGVVALMQWWTSPRGSNPTPALDWQPLLRVARQDTRLLSPAPASLPAGWKVTSESYERTDPPSWHLGILTGKGTYFGIDEGQGSEQDLVTRVVGDSAAEGRTVQIPAARSLLLRGTWHGWAEPSGDVALSRRVGTSTVVVSTNRSQAQLVKFAVSLTSRQSAPRS